MTTANKRRGRPKGSGIDDSARLQDIADRIAAQPTLKPTTAIRAMGITDPSSIRRLRDKYKKFATAQKSCRKLTPQARSSQFNTPATGHELRATAARGETEGCRKNKGPSSARKARKNCDNSAANGYQQSSQLAMVAPPPLDTDWVASWCSSNLGTMSNVMEAQLAVTNSMLSVPYFAMAMRQQMALNAFALSVLPPGYRRRTLH